LGGGGGDGDSMFTARRFLGRARLVRRRDEKAEFLVGVPLTSRRAKEEEVPTTVIDCHRMHMRQVEEVYFRFYRRRRGTFSAGGGEEEEKGLASLLRFSVFVGGKAVVE